MISRIISICLLSLACYTFSYGQIVELQGLITDTLDQSLEGASVVLLEAKDSTLAEFAISEGDGSFAIKRISKGAYLLEVSYIGYQTYQQLLSLDEDLNLAPIALQPLVESIDEVLVEAERIPIEISGDTIKYNAEAFKTRPNASVEELLKRLPGVEVGRDGAIKAQGEDVAKVLVDGKEFFGNDPKIATKNLPADIVNQVQVFDEKSETAQFTGVDDGAREKTINLTLKNGKNKGYFGNIEGGYGTEQRFLGKANLNRFTKKMQLSTIGRINNINQQGFTIQEYFEMMGGMQAAMSGGLMINPSELGISMDGEDQNQGFVESGSGGLNFNYDFNPETEFSLNYFYNQFNREEEKRANRTSFLENQQSFFSKENSQQEALNKNHRINTRFKHEIDSTQNLQLRLNVGFNKQSLDRESFQETLNSSQVFLNSSDQMNNQANQKFDLKSSLLYRKRFRKAGRSFVSNLSLGNQETMGDNQISALNIFQDLSDQLAQTQETDQFQWDYTANFTYTEPLNKGRYLSLRYNRQSYEEQLDKDFYDLVGEQIFRNDLLSNQFISDYIYDRGGLSLQVNRKKIQLTAGLDAQNSRLKADFRSETPNLDRSFSNWLPNFSFNWDIKSSQNIRLTYRTSLREPTIRQLQPVIDNSNPLSIYVGNPNLKPAYSHQLSLQSLWFNQFSFTNIFGNINLNYTKNQITNSRSIDDNLRQIIEPVNVKDNLLLNGQFSFGTPIRPIKSSINLETRFNYNRGILFVNDVENQVDQFNTNLRLNLSNRKKERVDIVIGTSLGYTSTNYSISEYFNRDFINQSYFLEMSWELSSKWQISSDFEHVIYPKVDFGAAQSFSLLEVGLSRRLFKDERGTLQLRVFDLLNQNVGINRNASANYVLDEQVLSLGRYFMLSFKYQIKKFGS